MTEKNHFDIQVLFEDESFLVLNKPPGIVVNNAESVKGETVQDWAYDKLKINNYELVIENSDFVNRAGIVHRIDKETSGILLIAKNPSSFRELQRQFKERLIHKTYVALVHGNIEPPTGEIRAPVARLPWNRERFGIVPGGKDATTKYKLITNYELPYALVELFPESGRTHQIRVHLKYINHPIIGDYLYAGRKTSRDDRTWAPRVMLHAWKIKVSHPTTGQILAFEASIPDDMNEVTNSWKHKITP